MNQFLQLNFFNLKISAFETESAEGIIFLERKILLLKISAFVTKIFLLNWSCYFRVQFKFFSVPIIMDHRALLACRNPCIEVAVIYHKIASKGK